MKKVLAVIVFIVLILLGTFFARVSDGGVGSAILGYALGVSAFIFAPMIWKSK